MVALSGFVFLMKTPDHYLLDTVQAHTEKQAVVGECHSTFQGVVAEGKLAGLWVVQTCASPQRGGQLASLSGP